MSDNKAGDFMEPIELANHSVCHLMTGGDLAKNQIEMTVSHKRTRVALFSFRTSKEFLGTLLEVLDMQKSSVLTMGEDPSKIKTKVVARKGMCKMTAIIGPNTKVVHRFPVDDDFSWGKMTFMFNDWVEVKRVLHENEIL